MQECREDLPGSGAAGSEDEDPARRSHSVFSLFLFCFGFSCSFLPLLVFLCYSSLLCVSTVLCSTLSVFPLFRLSHLLCVFFSGSWPVRPLFFFCFQSLTLSVFLLSFSVSCVRFSSAPLWFSRSKSPASSASFLLFFF